LDIINNSINAINVILYVILALIKLNA
jgi:hypothetical protein